MVWTIPADAGQAVAQGGQATHETPAPAFPSYYPRGPLGIAELPGGLCDQGVGPMQFRATIAAIDWRRRRCRLSDGRQFGYRDLVTALPLPGLVRLLEGAPTDVAASAAQLDASPITVVHLGVKYSTGVLPAHWTYFPDPEVPFYRMTRFERIAPQLSPEGASTLILECPGWLTPDVDDVVGALLRIGVLRDRHLDAYGIVRIPHAYVRFRPGHRELVKMLHEFLRSHGIHATGRYGLWRYLNIEQTLQSGLDTAEALAPRPSPATEQRQLSTAG